MADKQKSKHPSCDNDGCDRPVSSNEYCILHVKKDGKSLNDILSYLRIETDVDFNEAYLKESSLVGANLSGTNLSDANLVRADLSNANLSEADLTNAKLSGDISKAHLSTSKSITDMTADLSNADLSDANLSQAHLPGTNLKEANLSHATLSGALMSKANLSGANLSEADLSEWIVPPKQKSQRTASETLYNRIKTDLSDANLTGANLSKANLSGTKLNNSNLKEANLSKAVLSGARIEGVELHNCDLTNIDILDDIPSKSEIKDDSIKNQREIKQIVHSMLNSSEQNTIARGIQAVGLLSDYIPEQCSEFIEPIIDRLNNDWIPKEKLKYQTNPMKWNYHPNYKWSTTVQLSGIRAVTTLAIETDAKITTGDRMFAQLIKNKNSLINKEILASISPILIAQPESFPETIEAVEKALDHSDSKVRLLAIQTIAVLNRDAPEMVNQSEKLITAVEQLDKDPMVSTSTVQELNKILTFESDMGGDS